MNNADFWASVRTIIAEGFTPEGLLKLDRYAEQFISGRLVYQRFSPQEQHGCATGGATNVIASLLAGAEVGSDSPNSEALSDYERDCQRGAQHNTYFPETKMTVIGFGRNRDGEFKVIVEQPFIDGQPVSRTAAGWHKKTDK